MTKLLPHLKSIQNPNKHIGRWALFWMLLPIFFLVCYDAFSGHRAGGQYYWECVDDSTYVLKWNAYIDCDHNVDPQSAYFIYSGIGGDPNVGSFSIDLSVPLRIRSSIRAHHATFPG